MGIIEIIRLSLEIIYYAAFVGLTVLIVWYTRKTYLNAEKQPPLLYARINYNLSLVTKSNDYPVTIDLLNDGDELMTNIMIEFGAAGKVLQKETIPFISEHKLYKYYIGELHMATRSITWMDGTTTEAFPTDPNPSDEISCCDLIVDREKYTIKVLHR